MVDVPPKPAVRGGLISPILIGGLSAAVLDFVAACVVNRLPPITIGQAIASGLLGRAAFQGGVGAAMLGALAHTLILLVAAAAYVIAAKRWSLLTRRAPVTGPLYGVAVWMVMTWIVVPLSAASLRAPSATDIAVQLAIHAGLVGLPIALAARRFSAARP
ncbi:hypothetical protein [Phenylobacterium sp.]|jgi:hypothetical protein|uniref:hypothetical protein n=1 Tax=Phenylobacterium sp. TaxID=1871053 RepID=UPI002E374CAC|nr:hypothetical protein [Phenylobacterium sp.]HEX2561372.1 hypothetical protein [Phenylobacterium sp.]